MRFENSPAMEVTWPPGSLMCRKVGSESSSATKGSSIVSVDGKKRLPARPCAEATAGQAQRASAAAK